MREVQRAMPRTEPCKVCGRNISKGHQCFALFDAESEKDFLHIWFAHPSCAREADWLTHREWANHPIYGDRKVILFWADVVERKRQNGNLEYVR